MLTIAALPLETRAARIRPLLHRDAEAYAEGTKDPAVRTYAHLPAAEYTTGSVLEMIDGPVRAGLDQGDLAVLAIADAATDAFAGSVVLFDVSAEQAEVGFWVHPAARHGGLASAALDLAGRLAQVNGLRLTARTVTENLASQRVLTRAGFRQTHRGRGTAPSGDEVDLLHYERLLGSRHPQPHTRSC